MPITLTGATGFIGKALIERLGEGECRILSRSGHFQWDPMAGPPPAAALEGSRAVIHLAGEPVAQRWTAQAKQRIRESRVVGTRNLVEGLRRLDRKPEVLISSSGIGYYGSRGSEVLTEQSAPGHGFLPEVSLAWEREALAAEELGVRVVVIRTGIVLGNGGGALKKMLPPFRMGAGGVLGSGRQWMSWIHLDDLVSMMLWALENPACRGPLNGTAPYPVTNLEFTRKLGQALRRPTIFPVPSLALRLLYGEMAEMLLEGQRVQPRAALDGGFDFRYTVLGDALASLRL